MNYRVNKFNVNLGFDVNEDCILNATKELNNFIKEETGRKPIVLPIILNIKK